MRADTEGARAVGLPRCARTGLLRSLLGAGRLRRLHCWALGGFAASLLGTTD